MSQVIPLEPVPAQSLSVVLEGVRYDIAVKEAAGCMCVDIARDSVQVVQGERAVNGYPLLPYFYQEQAQGNFIFITEDEALPYWDQFGATTFLVFTPNAELEAIRAGT